MIQNHSERSALGCVFLTRDCITLALFAPPFGAFRATAIACREDKPWN